MRGLLKYSLPVLVFFIFFIEAGNAQTIKADIKIPENIAPEVIEKNIKKPSFNNSNC